MVELEVEVEEVAAFVTERRGLSWVAQGIFFGGPFPTVPSPLQVHTCFHFFYLVLFGFLFVLFWGYWRYCCGWCLWGGC